jgi:8-oxo-dGTP pyrophosphatase MutT (NUDIX family)
MLDLAGSARRELFEETGLDIGAMQAQPGWTLVRESGFLALLKRVTANQSAGDLRARIMRYLASEAQPEFSEIRMLRGPADIDEDMPRFLQAYLATAWRETSRRSKPDGPN